MIARVGVPGDQHFKGIGIREWGIGNGYWNPETEGGLSNPPYECLKFAGLHPAPIRFIIRVITQIFQGTIPMQVDDPVGDPVEEIAVVRNSQDRPIEIQ